MKFSHSFSVDAADIDELGHVNNVAYVRWVQGIAVAHWRDATSAEIQEQFFWVVVRHEIDYKKEALIGDAIVATTWVGEWTGETCERSPRSGGAMTCSWPVERYGVCVAEKRHGQQGSVKI